MDKLLLVITVLGIAFAVQLNVIACFYIQRMHRSLKLEKDIEQLNAVQSVTDIGSIDASWH